VWVKQKQNVVIADPDGNGIVLTFWSLIQLKSQS
jgi:hypothetical protein